MWRARLLAKVLDSNISASKVEDKSHSNGSKRQLKGSEGGEPPSAYWISQRPCHPGICWWALPSPMGSLPCPPPPAPTPHHHHHTDTFRTPGKPRKMPLLQTSPFPFISTRLSFYTPKRSMLGFTAAGYFLSFGDLLIHRHKIKTF